LADPDCEEYFGGFAVTGGRQFRSLLAGHSSGNSAEIASLYFEYEANGPLLGIWIPAAADLPPWTGSVEVLAADTNRQLTHQLLVRGEFVQFPLVDGQWVVRATGDIPDAYLSRLVCGPASLDSEITLFDAERTPGRVIGPASPIRLGDSVWLVTRSSALLIDQPECIQTEQRGTFGGWLVFRVTLPATASVSELRAIQKWLRRQIRPSLVKVWVDSPNPVAMTPLGAHVFALSDGPMTIRSDQTVDFSIESCLTLDLAILGTGVREVVWTPNEPGAYRIRVNKWPYMTLLLESEVPVMRDPIEVTTGAHAFSNLYEAQRYFDALEKGERQRLKLNVRWSSGRLLELLQSNRASVNVCATGFDFVLEPGGEVSFGDLGRFQWPLAPAVSSTSEISPAFLAKIRWLLGVSVEGRTGPVVLRDVPIALLGTPALRELRERSWPLKYATHVAAVAKQIRGWR
jgi:hypothetical protein